jgi:hypothetical protein
VSSATLINDNSTTITITVTVRDKDGAIRPGATVVLARSPASGTLTQPAAVSDANGVATGTFKSSVATLYTFSATANGIPTTDTDACTTFSSIGAIDPTTSTISLAASSAGAGGSAVRVTLQGKDSNSVNLDSGGATVVFTKTGGTSVISIGSTTDVGDGTYYADITPTTEGTAVTIGATIGGNAATDTDNFTVTAAYATPDLKDNASFESTWDGFVNGSGGTPSGSTIGYDPTLDGIPAPPLGTKCIKRVLAKSLYTVTSISAASPAVITATGAFASDGGFGWANGAIEVLGVTGDTSCNVTYGNGLYAKRLTDDTAELYTNAGLTTPKSSTGATGGTCGWDKGGHVALPFGTSNGVGCVNEIWTRFYFYITDVPTSDFKFLHFHDSLSYSLQLGGLYFFQAQRRFGYLWTAESIIQGTNFRVSLLDPTEVVGAWHSVEMHLYHYGDDSVGGTAGVGYATLETWFDNTILTNPYGNGIGGGVWSGSKYTPNVRRQTALLPNANTNKIGVVGEGLGVLNRGNTNRCVLYLDKWSVSTLGRIGP